MVAFLWLYKSFNQEPDITYIRLDGLQKIEVSSSEYPYFTYSITNGHATFFKEKSLLYKTVSATTDISSYDHYSFTFIYGDQQQVLLYYTLTLNELSTREHQLVEPSTNCKEGLLNLIAAYRQEIRKTYGALLVWEDVDRIFPMYATAKITDIYSGESFHVQRREGNTHVDAQPLTAEDTAIMKKIYGGQWSWDRKGIIVEVGGSRIAASMHGMPHGGGKLDDNSFPGHFCIHFLGSIIHGGGMDIRHHREILKAAGKLPITH
ncbi:MAG: hypothetical protein NUK65_02960 [Firmicutes bacterium]|nr:hypothetical protein [Bacillota bacterium]